MKIQSKKLSPILLAAAVLILALAVIGQLPALATNVTNTSDDPLQSYRDTLAEINSRIEGLENDISQQENLISGLEGEIAQLDSQLITVNQQMQVAQTAIDETNVLVAEVDQQIAATKERLDERQAMLEQRLVDLYVYGDISLLDVFFETGSFEEFITLIDMMETVISNDKALAQGITKEMEKLSYDKYLLEQYLGSLTQMQQDYYDMASDLNRLENEKKIAINEANMTLEEYQAYMDAEEAMAEAASDKIRELLASSDSTLSYGGVMIWPTSSAYTYVSSPYGWRTHPVYGDQRFHSGIDIAADGGAPIYAAADGKIIMREYYGGYGYCIMIDHGDGVVSLYAHQSAFGEFAVGDYVVAGDTIGYVGTTGTSTGNHLHFETRINGEYCDPWSYLQ